MSTTVEIKGELELYLRQLIDAGLYNNVAEAVRDSIRHLMKE
ncbi:MAG: nuclease, partial [Methanosarcinaceae archaeon]|nr:nuclease [Methanosarcinaceae archaeon]